MLCLHLNFNQGKPLRRSSYLTLVNSSSVYTGATLAPGALSAEDKKIEPVGNSKNMLASRSEVMAFVAIAFYFLILDWQTETSRLHKLWLLLHLKRLRRKRMVLLQIALKNTVRARCAWVWP